MAKNELAKGSYLTNLQELDGNTLRDFVDPQHKASTQELKTLLAIVKNRNLNPFTKEVYFIKYGSAPAQIVVSKEAIMKRAEENPNFDGFEAGIVVETKEGEIKHLTGTIAPKNAKLRGGWCKVYRKDRSRAVEADANFEYYDKTNPKNVTPWEKMPALMIRKVAIVSAFREAFSESVGGLYTADEMQQETQAEVRKRRMREAERELLLAEMETKSRRKEYKEDSDEKQKQKEAEAVEFLEKPAQEENLEW